MSPSERADRPSRDRVVLPRRTWERLFGATSGHTALPSLPTGFPAEPRPVQPGDPVPERTDRETDVWLTEWQVEEDGFDVAVGEQVAWTAYESDQPWIDLILSVPRDVPLQRDTYEHERSTEERSTRCDLRGVVTRIDQVSVHFVSAARAGQSEPRPRDGQQHSVSSLSDRRPHHGDILGWIVRVRP